jgi:hypothetical protein
MEIEFQGQYDKGTVFQAVKLANKSSKLNSVIRIGLIAFIALIFIAYYVSIANKESLSSFEVLRSGRHLITIPILLYFLLRPYIGSYQTAVKLWKNPTMQKPLSGIISSQGVAYVSSTGRREIDWAKFAKKQITESLIVLLTADGVLSFFPRHFFKSDNEWRTVVQWINSKVVEAV